MSEGSGWLIVGVLVPGALASFFAWLASRERDKRITGTPDFDPALEHLSTITGRPSTSLRPCRGQVLERVGEADGLRPSSWRVLDEFPAAVRIDTSSGLVAFGGVFDYRYEVDHAADVMVQVVDPQAPLGVPASGDEVYAVMMTTQPLGGHVIEVDAIELS